MIIFLNVLPLFIATYISAIYFRKQELYSAIALLIILVTILILSKFSILSSIVIIILGFLMAFTEWICVTKFNMWKYNYSYYQVPLWLPFAWSISIIFAYYIIEITKTM